MCRPDRVLLALLALAAPACRRASLQADADGTGFITADASADSIASDAQPATDAAAPSADANCGTTEYGENVYPSDILVLLDQSVSGDKTAWNQLLTALTAAIDRNAYRISWGLYTFPEAGPACGPDTAAPVIDVPVTYADFAAVAAGIDASRSDGNGSPAAAAINLAHSYLPTLPHAPTKILMLVTDHAPSCAGAIGALSSDAARAQADALAAVTAAAADGFETIVVAPSTTAASEIAALNALADAGGEYARTGEALRFQDETSLPQLFKPRPTDHDCDVSVFAVPPVPDNVTLTLNGVAVPRDTSHKNGWDFTDGTLKTAQLFGDWCVTLRATQSWRVVFYFGCG